MLTYSVGNCEMNYICSKSRMDGRGYIQKMIKYLVLAFLLADLITAQKPPGSPWLTLRGQRPVPIARGGFSGLFPESSRLAYEFVPPSSLHETIFYCDLQLTKDGVGFCQTELRLDNSTNIAVIFPQGRKTYNVNGKDVQGWFAIDYFADELLSNVTLVQNVLSRTYSFDGQPILLVEDISGMTKPPPQVWVNVQYDLFYHQHRISPVLYLQNLRFAGISYISSPEISFLKSIVTKAGRARTKLVFRFLEPEALEPTTNQTYGAILKNLAAIKQFASGILVPKTYIWPVTKDLYLLPPTTLVTDAHKQGLEVYAYGFANDMPGSYNYSYDPTAEYLQFIDNGQFSVDGVLTDFPATASETIACLAHNKNASKPHKGRQTLIITHDGASGDYPGCTDLAYEKAVMDGADIIDCSVQMSKDGVAFCLGSADISVDSNAVTAFMSRASNVPEIQEKNGVFSFDLTWAEIQTLKPQLNTPLTQLAALPRNPAFKDKGKFLTLVEFLDFAKAKAVTGIKVNIQNAAYFASKKGLDIVGAVTTALSNATFDKQSTQQVMIQSDDTSVLAKFKDFPSYQRVYTIEEAISDAPKSSVDEIKKYADAVDVRRTSIFETTGSFLKNFTTVVEQMHALNVSVHVSTLYNEYTTLPFDVMADPIMELATLIEGLKVDAVVTEYPATANTYMRSPCADPTNTNLEYPITSVAPGALLELAAHTSLPPQAAPAPALDAADIVDPPLPSVTKAASSPTPSSDNNKKSGSSQRSTVNLCLLLSAALILSSVLTGH